MCYDVTARFPAGSYPYGHIGLRLSNGAKVMSARDALQEADACGHTFRRKVRR